MESTPSAQHTVTVPEFIKLLEQQIKQFQTEGRYAEALVAHNRRELLLKNEEIRRNEQARLKRVTQRAAMEESQLKEFEQFTSMYMEKLAAVEEELNAQRAQLKAKHVDELKAFTTKVNETTFRPKFSAELLRLRKQQELLAKMHDYIEAHKVKLQADKCETVEIAKSQKEKKKLIAKKEQIILNRQAAEVENLEARLVTKRDAFVASQQHEMQRILKRFHNTLTDIDMPSKNPQVPLLPREAFATPRPTKTDEQYTSRATSRSTSTPRNAVAVPSIPTTPPSSSKNHRSISTPRASTQTTPSKAKGPT